MKETRPIHRIKTFWDFVPSAVTITSVNQYITDIGD